MRYMLDTNICSYILKNHPASVKLNLKRLALEIYALQQLYSLNYITVQLAILKELSYGAKLITSYRDWLLFRGMKSPQIIMGRSGPLWKKPARLQVPWIC